LVVIFFVFGCIGVDLGGYLLLDGVEGVYLLVWEQMYLLCVGIQVVV
jgi:hypothetical protein